MTPHNTNTPTLRTRIDKHLSTCTCKHTNKTSHSQKANSALLICSRLTHIVTSQAPPSRGRKTSVAGSGRPEIDAPKTIQSTAKRKSRRLRSSHTAGGGRVPRLHHPVRLQATPPTYPPLLAPCNGQPGRGQAAETQQAAGWAMKAEHHLQTLGAPQRSSWAASESGHTREARKARTRQT